MSLACKRPARRTAALSILVCVAMVCASCGHEPLQRLNWNEIQDLGGLVVHDPVALADGGAQFPIEFDASGRTEVTTRPSRQDPDHVVRSTEATVDGRTISFQLLLGLADGSRASDDPPPIVVRVEPGLYQVSYRDPKASLVALRIVRVGDQDRGLYESVSGSRFHARIFPPSAAPVAKTDQTWLPTPADVLRAEGRIVDALNAARRTPDAVAADFSPEHQLDRLGSVLTRLNHYGAQCTGVIRNGHRRIWCNFYACSTDQEPAESWVSVIDGGVDYWNIKYDIDADRCLDFICNGDA